MLKSIIDNRAVAVLTSVLWLCSQSRAQGPANTSLAAVTAALAYVRPSSTVPPVPGTSTLLNTRSILGQQTGYGQDGRKPCKFSQSFNMTGQWSHSPSPSFHGFYNMTADCPSYAQDFDCQTPQKDGIYDVTPAFIDTEYSQTFTPDDCFLREFDADNFNTQMQGRRLLFLGDSLMRGNWLSLACLLRNQTVHGSSSIWVPADTDLAPGNFTVQWGPDGTINVTKQYVGEFTLKSGGKVIVRDHSHYSQELYDAIMAEWEPLTDKDILVISYGGWYPRFIWQQDQVCWTAYKDHVSHLFQDRLVTFPGRVVWKEYTPQHFGGPYGLVLGLPEGDVGTHQTECQPASVGEFWYDDFVRGLLNSSCKEDCKRIQILPIYEMTRQRPFYHDGAFGRGRSKGDADCKHYCSGMLDWWNVVLYNMLW